MAKTLVNTYPGQATKRVRSIEATLSRAMMLASETAQVDFTDSERLALDNLAGDISVLMAEARAIRQDVERRERGEQ